MKHELNLKWDSGMSFSTDLDGHNIVIDAAAEFGGTNKGPRPKAMLLTALAGCSAMDVVSLLDKMRVDYKTFNVRVVADLLDEHPKKYTDIKLIYELTGSNIVREKVDKAIKLSEEKYCGVWATLKDSVKITYEIDIKG
jgi:putative redox protein